MLSEFSNLYKKPSTSNKVFLFNMRMLKGGSVADHLNDFNTLTSQLSSVKVNFDDEVRDLLILCSFLQSWNGLDMDVSNSIPIPKTL